MPTEGLLSVDIDVTDLFESVDYMGWKEELEDILRDIDVRHALRESKTSGRRIQASYKTVMDQASRAKHRIRVVNVSPYPSRFNSVLSNLRTKIYGSQFSVGILPKYGEVIAQVQKGIQLVKLYLIPASNIGHMNDAIDNLNVIIDNLRNNIRAYELGNDYNQIITHLLRVPSGRWSKYPVQANIYNIRMSQIPFVVSKEIIDTYMDERTRKEVEATVRRAVSSVATDIQNRIKTIIESYWNVINKKYSEKDVSKLRALTANLKGFPESRRWFPSEVDALEAMIEAVGVENADPDKVYSAIHGMARVMRIENSESMKTEDVVKAITTKLTEGISPEVVAMLDALA